MTVQMNHVKIVLWSHAESTNARMVGTIRFKEFKANVEDVMINVKNVYKTSVINVGKVTE